MRDPSLNTHLIIFNSLNLLQTIINLTYFYLLWKTTISFDNIFDYGEPNFLTITEIMAKPFSFVSGDVPNRGFNPFRRKSGILSVLAKQDRRSRIMGKTGSLHTVGFDEGNTDKYLKDIFISIIDLVSAAYLEYYFNGIVLIKKTYWKV